MLKKKASNDLDLDLSRRPDLDLDPVLSPGRGLGHGPSPCPRNRKLEEADPVPNRVDHIRPGKLRYQNTFGLMPVQGLKANVKLQGPCPNL